MAVRYGAKLATEGMVPGLMVPVQVAGLEWVVVNADPMTWRSLPEGVREGLRWRR